MRPLPWVATGLVVVLLTADLGGYDLLANPLGWVLVGYGAARLRADTVARRRLLALVWGAGLVAALVWPAPVAHWLEATDDSLAWAASLPAVAATVALCVTSARLAEAGGDRRAAGWLRIARTLSLAAGALPVLVLGGGLDGLDAATDVVSVAAPFLLLVLSLRYAGRPWAAALEPVERIEPSGPVRPG